MRTITATVVVVALMAAVCAGQSNTVTTTAGKVEGYTRDGARVWRGIPFAAAPVEKLRFAPPAKPTPWSGVRKTVVNGHICPQAASVAGIVIGSEDCLYLNVYAPEGAGPDSGLPVMAWIFGGGWVVGDLEESLPPPEEGDGLYDGKHLATKHNVVIVAMNYRLSALGFMAFDALRDAASGNTTGNYALQDQRAALEWIRDNIRGFGGDPGRVTIFGESAGAFSVCWHLASPLSAPLFHAAIVVSGTCDSPIFFREWQRAVEWSSEYAAKVGCPGGDSAATVECLRGLSTAKILGAGELLRFKAGVGAGPFVPRLAPIMPWGAAIDGTAAGQTGTPLAAIRAGTFAKVPTIFGTNNNEGSIFVPMLAGITKTTLPLNAAKASTVLAHFFNASTVAAVWELYPVANYKDYDDAASMVLRDYFFVCAERKALLSMTAQGVPVWSYRFNYQDDNPLGPVFGRSHASGLRFIFDNRFYGGWSADDQAMAAQFGAYFSSLARYHDPNGAAAPNLIHWPAFNATSPLNIILDIPSSIADNYDASVCPFWDTVTIDYS